MQKFCRKHRNDCSLVKTTSPFWALVLLVCLEAPVFCQSPARAIVTQPTEWIALNSTIKLHRRFGFAFDGQLRFVGPLQNFQHYVRNGLEVYITPKLSIVPVGYMYVWNFRYGKQPAEFANNEQRIWQQILYRSRYRKFFFEHRFRLEERFIQHHHTEPDGSVIYNGYKTYANRIRYRLQARFSLNKPTIEPRAWFISAYDEVFYSWGPNITFRKPDQNRLYAAIGYQFNKKCSLQVGPFYQMWIKKNGEEQENNVGALIQVGYNLDFTRQN